MSVFIRLVGGPCDGKLLAITEEMYDAGYVVMEVYEGVSVHVAVEAIPPTTRFSEVKYLRRGRDNAAFEFGGPCQTRNQTP